MGTLDFSGMGFSTRCALHAIPLGMVDMLQALRSRRGKEENEVQRHQQEKEVSSNGRHRKNTPLFAENCIQLRLCWVVAGFFSKQAKS